jgi:hypothetical protein
MQECYVTATAIVREWRGLPERDYNELVSMIAAALGEKDAKIARLEAVCALHGVDTTEARSPKA